MKDSFKEMLDSIKWGTCIPLIGGSAIGCAQTIGHEPEYHLTYKAFGFNEKQIRNYWKDVPYFVLDDENFDVSSIPTKDMDFINAVCPCAGLSMLNVHASADAKQNDWLYMSTEFVLEHIKPKVPQPHRMPMRLFAPPIQHLPPMRLTKAFREIQQNCTA